MNIPGSYFITNMFGAECMNTCTEEIKGKAKKMNSSRVFQSQNKHVETAVLPQRFGEVLLPSPLHILHAVPSSFATDFVFVRILKVW